MDLSTFAIRLCFLCLPGLIATRLLRVLRGKKDRKNWEEFIDILFFSLLCYLILAFLLLIWNLLLPPHKLKWPELSAINGFINEKEPLDWTEITIASFTGILLALLTSYIQTYNLANQLFSRLRITNKIVDKDVWEIFYQHPEYGKSKWMFIRDHKLNVTYFGCVTVYSETDQDRELIIENVSVFANGRLLYESPCIYIARNKDDLTIELPQLPIEETKDEKEE